jgi:hypothetical protein
MGSSIGDTKPIVGGFSTQFNGGGGDGAHDPLPPRGSKDPGGTKPTKPGLVPVPLNGTGGKKK